MHLGCIFLEIAAPAAISGISGYHRVPALHLGASVWEMAISDGAISLISVHLRASAGCPCWRCGALRGALGGALLDWLVPALIGRCRAVPLFIARCPGLLFGIG